MRTQQGMVELIKNSNNLLSSWGAGETKEEMLTGILKEWPPGGQWNHGGPGTGAGTTEGDAFRQKQNYEGNTASA